MPVHRGIEKSVQSVNESDGQLFIFLPFQFCRNGGLNAQKNKAAKMERRGRDGLFLDVLVHLHLFVNEGL